MYPGEKGGEPGSIKLHMVELNCIILDLITETLVAVK